MGRARRDRIDERNVVLCDLWVCWPGSCIRGREKVGQLGCSPTMKDENRAGEGKAELTGEEIPTKRPSPSLLPSLFLLGEIRPVSPSPTCW